MRTYPWVIAMLLSIVSVSKAFDPYVFERTKHEYSYGGYGVIDPDKNTVVRTGNILQELLADSTFYTKHTFLEEHDAIGDYYIDRKFGRLFLWTGLRDESYDGTLLLDVRTRAPLAYLKDTGSWGQASAIVDVSANNVIYEMSWADFGGPRDPVANAKEAEDIAVYDGHTYEKVKFSKVPEFGVSRLSSCFLSDRNEIYDDLGGGLFDVAQNKLIRKKNEFLTDTVFLGCISGQALLAQNMDSKKQGSSGAIYLYDVAKDTVSLTVHPLNIQGWSYRQWLLSPNAKYVVWGYCLDGGGHHIDAVIKDGRLAVFNAVTGKQFDLALPDLLGYKKNDRRYVFAGFSLDGEKFLFHDGKTVYVYDMRDMKISNRVPVPFYPDFIVWP